MNQTSQPFVSVILPILNEERDLENCISAILQQDYSGGIEIILALGPSKDKTTQIAKALSAGDDRIKLVDNPSGQTAAGKRSDTMLLVHISKARDKAVLISIPRDSFALIPAYTNKAGKVIPARHSKINSAFNWGGAPLLIQTIEEMTQLKIDHYVEINFAGFARVVDALGGIEVCTSYAI